MSGSGRHPQPLGIGRCPSSGSLSSGSVHQVSERCGESSEPPSRTTSSCAAPAGAESSPEMVISRWSSPASIRGPSAFQFELRVLAHIGPCRCVHILPAQGVCDGTSRHEKARCGRGFFAGRAGFSRDGDGWIAAIWRTLAMAPWHAMPRRSISNRSGDIAGLARADWSARRRPTLRPANG